MLGARLLPTQPTQHSKPPAIRVGGAPTRPSMGPVNSPVDTQGKRSPFLIFVMFHTEKTRFQRYQNTGIYYISGNPPTMSCLPTCTMQTLNPVLFTHLHQTQNHVLFPHQHQTQNHVLFTHLHQMTDQCSRTGQGHRAALACWTCLGCPGTLNPGQRSFPGKLRKRSNSLRRPATDLCT